MENLTIIACIGSNNELGKDNKLVFNIHEDMRYFKENTLNKTVVMGKNTFYSLPKILPNRKNIVISRTLLPTPGIVIFKSIDEFLRYADTHLDEDIMIIGGAKLYKSLLVYTDRLLLTEVNKRVDANVYFPSINYDEWNKTVLSSHVENGLEYTHNEYVRKRHIN